MARPLLTTLDRHTSDTAPLNDYPDNWADISETFKHKTGHRCQKCSIQLTGSNSRYLHVHHKNGLKNECDDSNLESLCVGCHADEPLHGHMKAHPDYKEFLAQFRSG